MHSLNSFQTLAAQLAKGFKPGELYLFGTGRQTGKSMIRHRLWNQWRDVCQKTNDDMGEIKKLAFGDFPHGWSHYAIKTFVSRPSVYAFRDTQATGRMCFHRNHILFEERSDAILWRMSQ